jgi:hypothetical protein
LGLLFVFSELTSPTMGGLPGSECSDSRAGWIQVKRNSKNKDACPRDTLGQVLPVQALNRSIKAVPSHGNHGVACFRKVNLFI